MGRSAGIAGRSLAQSRTEVLMSSGLARRHSSLNTIVIALLALALTRIAFAQDAAAPGIENSKYSASGVINANSVFVRSGPSDGDYAVMKIDKGSQVTVVGKRFDWLKIVPPDGSFC